MKLIPYSTAILVLLGALLSSAQAQAPETADPSVILSEICYLPKPGQAEWVELTNISDKPVDLNGWFLADGQLLRLVISEKSLLIPPSGFLTILFDGTGDKAANTVVFDAEKKSVLHSNKDAKGNMLGDDGGHIALYAPTVFRSEMPKLQSYVAWGFSPGYIIADAIRTKRWVVPGSTVMGTGPEILPVPTKIMVPGGSLGITQPVAKGQTFLPWGIFSPTEVNPGEMKFTRGITLAQPGDKLKVDNETGIFTLSVVPMSLGIKYQFQVCRDRSCQQIFLDSIRETSSYVFEKPMPKFNTYYWRARLSYPDGTFSSWSEVRSLTYGN